MFAVIDLAMLNQREVLNLSSSTNTLVVRRNLGDVINIGSGNLTGTITPADFQFATWNGISSGGFLATSSLPTITLIAGGSSGGSTRVKIEFADNAIRNS